MSATTIRSPFAAATWESLAVDPPARPPSFAPGLFGNLGSAVIDFAPAAAGEVFRVVNRKVQQLSDERMRRDQLDADPFLAEDILKRRVEVELESQRRDVAARDFVQRFTPDPAITGAGSQIVYGLGKTMVKAIPAMMAVGPVAGAGVAGALEGGAESIRLQDQGVDAETAGQVGLATGITTAFGFALPVAGATWARTAALAAAGGPASFMSQQQAARMILDRADYSEIAQQYDPFDPVGLTVSTAGSFLFGAGAMALRARAARAPADAPPPVTAEQEAAARSVMLSEQAELFALHAPDDLAAAPRHVEALQTAGRQLDEGKPVDVAKMVEFDSVPIQLYKRLMDIESLPVDRQASAPGMRAMFIAASRAKPKFDSLVAGIVSEVDGSAALLPELKGVRRSADKIASDYAGDATRIKDILRGTIEVQSLDQATAVIDLIQQRFELSPSGNRNLLRSDVDPVDGYRDAKFNVVIDGHVAELQVNVPALLRAKGKAHPAYERRSEIERQSSGRQRTADEQAEIDQLNAAMKAIYEPAWAEATSARNADQSIGAPLRLAETGSNTRGGSVSQAADENLQPGTLPSDTGMPSTSKNSTRLGSEAGSDGIDTSAFIVPRPAAIERAPAGRSVEIVTERGAALQVRYKAVEVTDLVTSHDDALRVNDSFPAELQPRDRTRAASEQQIAKIENRIDPELLAENRKASDGAPVIGPDGVVESGNARTIAVRRAYAGGKADAYRAWLIDNAERFGLNRSELEAMERPLLVRETPGGYDRAEFARQANEQSTARMSAPEQAKTDATRMPDLDGLAMNEDGSINQAASRGFIRDFLGKVVSPAEQGDMVTGDGMLSSAGLQRIRNALFAKAYGDPELVSMLTESTDANIRNILNGMMREAGDMAKLRDMIDSGARQPADFSGDLALAARQFSKLRAEGTPVEAFLAQGNLIDSPVTPEVGELLRALSENARSGARVADLIQRMIADVDSLGDPRQAGMFDAPAASVRDVAGRVGKAMREETAAAATAQGTLDISAAAREAIDADPALRVKTDPDGEPVPARQVLDDAKKQADDVRKEADALRAAIDCGLRRG